MFRWDSSGREPAGKAAEIPKPAMCGIVGGLDNDVGRYVVGVIGGEVVETTAGAQVSDEEVRVGVGGGVDVLGLFDPDGAGLNRPLSAETEYRADAPS